MQSIDKKLEIPEEKPPLEQTKSGPVYYLYRCPNCDNFKVHGIHDLSLTCECGTRFEVSPYMYSRKN